MTFSPPAFDILARRTRRLRQRLGLTRPRFFTPELGSPWLRLGLAILLPCLAALLFHRYALWFGPSRYLLFFYPAVVLAAWLGRLGGGLVATATSALLASSFFASPAGSFRIDDIEEARSIVLFAVMGILISSLFEGMYAGKIWAQRQAEERQQLADALVLSRQRFEVLLSNLPGIAWEARLETPLWPPHVHFVSPSAQRLSGYPPEEWIRSNLLWDRLLPEGDRAAFEAALQNAARRGSATHRHRWRHADGTMRVFETHVVATPSRTGAFQEVRCVSLDITELEGAERALASTERRFRQAADRAPIMIWIAQPERGNVWCNRGWLEFRGRTLEEEAGEGWRDGVHPDEREALEETVAAAFAAREEFRFEFRIRRADGAWRWVLSTGVPRTDSAGEFQDYLGFCIDISDRKQIELERETLLVETERARTEAALAARTKDEFLARVSHELRNPLNGILGWTQILTAPETGEEELRRGITLIDGSARTLSRLVDDLLDVSRILSGKLLLSLSPLKLDKVIEAACRAVTPAAEAKGVALDCETGDDLPRVVGDPHRLQQVLWNLLANAVKFTERGRRVELRVRHTGSTVDLVVRDEGIGIEPAFLPYVFAPFRQAEASSARTYQGLGLGLAIARHLVELHGGSIAAASEGPGTGATFTVRLPVATLLEAVDEPERAPVDTSGLDGIRVLVVDDDPVAREMLRALLERAGARVDESASAGAAFTALVGLRPDILVSDIEMPGEDGFSLLRRVRELPESRGGATPAVALTAYAQKADRHRALLAGFQEHLAKPVDATALLDTLRRLA
jgi:PAS domain S-box-containing protein